MGISRAEALDSLRSNDLVGIGMEADAVRRRLHPEGVVSYAVTCAVDCVSGEARRICADATESLEMGGNGLVLTGTSGLRLEEVVAIVRDLRDAHPQTWICGLNAGELARLAGGRHLEAMFALLTEAGWNAPASDAADWSLGPAEVEQWFAMHRAAHAAGLRTIAAMRFGGEETVEQRVEFLERVAALQSETGGFAAFAPESAGGGLHGPTAVECLKNVAVARLVLDAIPNVEVGRATSSLKVLETMLRFGADDAGEVLVRRARLPDLQEEDLRRVIRDAGFVPAERDPGYRMMFVD